MGGEGREGEGRGGEGSEGLKRDLVLFFQSVWSKNQRDVNGK